MNSLRKLRLNSGDFDSRKLVPCTRRLRVSPISVHSWMNRAIRLVHLILRSSYQIQSGWHSSFIQRLAEQQARFIKLIQEQSADNVHSLRHNCFRIIRLRRRHVFSDLGTHNVRLLRDHNAKLQLSGVLDWDFAHTSAWLDFGQFPTLMEIDWTALEAGRYSHLVLESLSASAEALS